MNDQQKHAIGNAYVAAEDALHEIQHGQHWITAVFCAIERAGTLEEARMLAEIGRHLAERHAGILGRDLANLQSEVASISKLGEVAA